MRGLDGKSAVVTGGASGIGRASSHRLAEEGTDVYVTDVDVDGGEETVRQINEENEDASGNAYFRELDVRDVDEFDAALAEADDELGSVDVLFNNAGIGEMQGFTETEPDHVDQLIDVNVKGVWNGCHAVFPIMEQQGSGSIVNTSSMAGWLPSNITTYGMTKAAVLHFTESVAPELGEYGIRINAICPGLIDTQMTRTWFSDEMREQAPMRTAFNRWGEPEEVAACVAFLASDDASYVTGRPIKVDAGYV
ncbi:SDR family oxidoreductase [Halogeometricum sp. S1BR25-6]|uniref:SDR family oxidoreductase n=1 Tax=Halogeometricum salsisoli TaxID=2950536 RepID=A0ABU2GH76_9EURY|nr:SDR family oxidoreductase [Halogeometricum sp. S1BR25-6]MDS0300182.1 SDR family oxidoreductase [Halogeometricum sp. S1BR25-6]